VELEDLEGNGTVYMTKKYHQQLIIFDITSYHLLVATYESF
jgi:hypothetical protein